MESQPGTKMSRTASEDCEEVLERFVVRCSRVSALVEQRPKLLPHLFG
jgi:hypothetical protein